MFISTWYFNEIVIVSKAASDNMFIIRLSQSSLPRDRKHTYYSVHINFGKTQ